MNQQDVDSLGYVFTALLGHVDFRYILILYYSLEHSIPVCTKTNPIAPPTYGKYQLNVNHERCVYENTMGQCNGQQLTKIPQPIWQTISIWHKLRIMNTLILA